MNSIEQIVWNCLSLCAATSQLKAKCYAQTSFNSPLSLSHPTLFCVFYSLALPPIVPSLSPLSLAVSKLLNGPRATLSRTLKILKKFDIESSWSKIKFIRIFLFLLNDQVRICWKKFSLKSSNDATKEMIKRHFSKNSLCARVRERELKKGERERVEERVRRRNFLESACMGLIWIKATQLLRVRVCVWQKEGENVCGRGF